MQNQIDKMNRQQLQLLAEKALKQQERAKKSAKKHQDKLKATGIKRVTIEANYELQAMLKQLSKLYKIDDPIIKKLKIYLLEQTKENENIDA